MRTSETKVNKLLLNRLESLFIQTLADIKTPQEAKDFIDAFLFPSEKESFVKRLALVYWLKKKRPYSVIKQNLKLSSATIAAGKSLLASKGIQNALKKIEADEWANQWSEKIKKFVGK